MTWSSKATYTLGNSLPKPKMVVGALIDVDYYQDVVGDDDNDNFAKICNCTENLGYDSEGGDDI